MTNKVDLAASGEREIVATRTFDAPRHLVFEAHTVPALVKRWMTGPEGWSMTKCEIDLKPGGAYRYEWSHADGQTMGMGGTFREVDAPALLTAMERFDQDWTGGETFNTMRFDESGGRTTLTTTIRFASAAARDSAIASNMGAGLAASYARLEEILAETPWGEGAKQ